MTDEERVTAIYRGYFGTSKIPAFTDADRSIIADFVALLAEVRRETLEHANNMLADILAEGLDMYLFGTDLGRKLESALDKLRAKAGTTI